MIYNREKNESQKQFFEETRSYNPQLYFFTHVDFLITTSYKKSTLWMG